MTLAGHRYTTSGCRNVAMNFTIDLPISTDAMSIASAVHYQ